MLQNDKKNIDTLLELTKKQATTYLHNLPNRSTYAPAATKSIDSLPKQALGALYALEQFNQRFEASMVASSGPRFWGYVIGGSTPAAIMGDWLATVYDQNPQLLQGEGDISANLEVETITMMLDLFNLPAEFGGGFVTGATVSNFTCLAVARQWLGKKMGKNIALEGVSGHFPILTATAHSSALKALSMLGLGSQNFVQVQCMEGNREAISMENLESHIIGLMEKQFILISSAGTVNTVDFDDFEAIADLRKRYDFWWHIDAAFGGFAACSPQYKHLVQGWEQADSITIDCHKWLNVPYESAVFFVKKQHNALQVEIFQNSNAPYLGDPSENFNFLNVLPENSRRLKALAAWFTLMAYGKNGYQQLVENCITLAKSFGLSLENHEKFELLAPVRLNNVCFSLQGADKQSEVFPFLKRLNETGIVFMTPTVYRGKKGIRASFVNWQTKLEDVEMVLLEMEKLL